MPAWPAPDRTRRILTLAVPIVGGMISQNVLNLIDTAMVGSLGKEALAGVGMASFVLFTSFALLVGLSSGVQAVAARRLGAGRGDEAASALHLGLGLAVALGVPIAVGMWVLAPGLFGVLVDDTAVVEQAVPYFRARLVSVVAIGANAAFRGFWNGVNRPGLYFRTLVTMHVVNVVVSAVLIFGWFGAPALGALGAGVGSAVATWLGTLQYVVLGFTQGRGHGFFSSTARPSREGLTGLISLAWPTSVQQLLFAAGFTVYFWILGRIGTDELAAGNVLINLVLVGILPGLGLGLAAASLVGQALGRDDPDDAAAWGWDVVKVGAVAMGLLGLPFVVFPDVALGVFLPEDPEVVALARLPLQLAMGTMVLEAVFLVLQHALMSAGAVRTVAVLAVGMQWGFFLPAAFLVGPTLGFGFLGVALVQVLQRSVQALVIARVWGRGSWRGIDV